MKKTKIWGLLTSAAAAAVLALAAAPWSASAAWEQIDSMGDLNGDKQVNDFLLINVKNIIFLKLKHNYSV